MSVGGSLQMTEGLAQATLQDLSATTVYLGPFTLGGSAVYERNPGGYVEHVGMSCDFETLQSSKAILFLKEKMLSIDSADGKPRMTVERDSQAVEIAVVDDLNALAEAVRIPLAGASDAIRRLAKDCPALRRQMARTCGSGD